MNKHTDTEGKLYVPSAISWLGGIKINVSAAANFFFGWGGGLYGLTKRMKKRASHFSQLDLQLKKNPNFCTEH